jgi:hypothetical protein
VVFHLETIHEGLEFLNGNLDEVILNDGDYQTIKKHWRVLMDEMISLYPENQVFWHYYDWHYGGKTIINNY